MKDIILTTWNAFDKEGITAKQLAGILKELPYPDIPVCFADMERLVAVHRIDILGTEYLVLTDKTQVGIDETQP